MLLERKNINDQGHFQSRSGRYFRSPLRRNIGVSIEVVLDINLVPGIIVTKSLRNFFSEKKCYMYFVGFGIKFTFKIECFTLTFWFSF